MTLFPRSLLGRTLAVLIGAMVLSQAAAIWFLHEYVTQPRQALGVGLFVSHLKTISAALQTMTAAQQQEFINRIAEKEGIRISPVRGTEQMRPAGDVAAVQLFRERIRELFGPQADVYVRALAEPVDDGKPRPRPQTFWVRLPTGERDFWVAFPRGRIERDPSTAFIEWGITGLAIAILGTFFIVWRLNRPLSELARAAVKLGQGTDPQRVAETGPSEIRDLTRAFNQMKDDLRKNERDRSTFLAGVSHDLRTPLSRLRLEVEMLEGKVDDTAQHAMIEDVGEMNAIIDQFIDFMRSEAAETLAPVNISELARNCAERAARAGVQVRCDLDEVPLLMLRPLAMQRLTDNLLGNAARHAGGEIVVRTRRDGGNVVLSVMDRGPGIPPEMVERLKEPFTRRDEARSGSSGAGLGLAIANRVATIHGGSLDLMAREGGGLEARVTLPAST
ncbi:MAG TPA: ATP-binding protein [Usitatibacter sp.]|jgi:two-component system osmolarity sensor histidine kinase EnvZ